MTLHELWRVSPQCFTFVRGKDGRVTEYNGTGTAGSMTVERILATKYPMYRHVLEVTLKK